ncbi:hypothetical protein ABW19_dt0203292 [Dactylella cylindrospora]|nr:hypothetical protein ABW19_dt0203292 [Dactylella cylindrospora]
MDSLESYEDRIIYSGRDVRFILPSGDFVRLPEDLILKYPYSKLADVASFSLPGEIAKLDLPLEDFNNLAEFLKTDRIEHSDEAKLSRLLKTLDLLQIPISDELKWKMKASTPSTGMDSGPSRPPLVNQDTGLPDYDSIPSAGFRDILSRPEKGEPLTIQRKIALAVEDRLINLLMSHLLPLVERQATSGIYNSIFILVPSNSSAPQKPSDALMSLYDSSTPTEQPEDKVIGLSRSNISLFKYVKLVKLTGRENTVEFLTQPQVIEELKGQLKARLQLPDPPPPPPPVVEPVSPPPKKSKWGWGRLSAPDTLPPPVAPIQPPAAPTAPIDVRIEELSRRRLDYMGIYQTVTDTVLVVEIVLS